VFLKNVMKVIGYFTCFYFLERHNYSILRL